MDETLVHHFTPEIIFISYLYKFKEIKNPVLADITYIEVFRQFIAMNETWVHHFTLYIIFSGYFHTSIITIYSGDLSPVDIPPSKLE